MKAPRLSLFAQAPPGLEPLLRSELAALGVTGTEMVGGVRWEGGWDTLVSVNLHSRLASRVLVEVESFGARALGELERKAGMVPWGDWLPEGPIHLRVSASRSRLYHEGAIEERLRRAMGREEPGDSDAQLLVVRVHRDRVTIRLDSSGEHLHRRGYRTLVGDAPIRENLAASALAAIGWEGDVPLLDPMAGSGTIPIEAALKARNIPPGLASEGLRPRGWAFQGWERFPASVLEEAVTRAQAKVLEAPPAPIFGSDRDGGAVELARANAKAAGVGDDVQWGEAPLTQAPRPDTAGWIVTNPPYGARLGDRRSLRPMYRALGALARDGWQLAFLATDPVLAGATALDPTPLFQTRHGGLAVTLFRSPPPPTPPSDP